MKNKIASFLAALLIGGTALLSAGNGKVKKITTPHPAKHIQNLVQLPEQFKQIGFEEKVKVLFTVDKTGRVENVLCVCANAELKNSVEMQFRQMQFQQTKTNTLYTIHINFKVL
jgi:hypothetical protein